MRWALAIVALAGCGRLGFDPIAGSGTDGATDGTRDASDPPAGLIARWKLDESSGVTAVDSIGGADGTLTAGSSVVPMWVAGHTDGALSFTGDGDNVVIGTPASLADLQALTISAWVFPTAVAPAGYRCIVDKGTPTAGWVFAFSEALAGDLAFSVGYGGTFVWRYSVGNVIAVGAWTHVVATWDGSPFASGVHLYVDAVEPAYGQQLDPTGTRPSDATVPTFLNCSAGGLSGKVDDVQIYNRALNAAEAMQL